MKTIKVRLQGRTKVHLAFENGDTLCGSANIAYSLRNRPRLLKLSDDNEVTCKTCLNIQRKRIKEE